MLRRYRIYIIIVLVLAVLAVFLFSYSIDIDSDAPDIRIVHLSDLHAKLFGQNNRGLIERTASLDPHIIVVAGDWIDQNTADISDAAKTLGELNKLAPVFYSPGNH